MIVGHSCKYPGCRQVLVLDGNMKNQREVCMARDAGYTTYGGLAGSVKTGCPNTPAYKCRYCKEHIQQSPMYDKCNRAEDDNGGVVQLLLAKKVTRNETYYQVYPCTFHKPLMSIRVHFVSSWHNFHIVHQIFKIPGHTCCAYSAYGTCTCMSCIRAQLHLVARST